MRCAMMSTLVAAGVGAGRRGMRCAKMTDLPAPVGSDTTCRRTPLAIAARLASMQSLWYGRRAVVLAARARARKMPRIFQELSKGTTN